TTECRVAARTDTVHQLGHLANGRHPSVPRRVVQRSTGHEPHRKITQDTRMTANESTGIRVPTARIQGAGHDHGVIAVWRAALLSRADIRGQPVCDERVTDHLSEAGSTAAFGSIYNENTHLSSPLSEVCDCAGRSTSADGHSRSLSI